MKILINSKNVTGTEEEICFIMSGDRKNGYQVLDKNNEYVNPFFADIGEEHWKYSEIIKEVMKPGTSLLYLEKDEIIYMATENYWIRCHAFAVDDEEDD